MRVRLSYSVDLDDVPSEVSNLIEKKIKLLHDALDLTEDATVRLHEKEVDLQITADVIDRARQKLAEFDLTLQDAQAILEGMIEAQKPQAPLPPSEPVGGPQPPWPPEDLDV